MPDDINPLQPGIDPGGNPEFLPTDPGGQLHGDPGASTDPRFNKLRPGRVKPSEPPPDAAKAPKGRGIPFGKTALVGAGALGLADFISSPLDFLKWIAWMFHPLNWLRMAEFLIGTLLAGWGIYILTARSARGGGASSHPVIRSVLSATPAGRAARVARGRRMGRHEGQREAARMEARQRETRPQREASAVEREQINRNARQSVREA
jgi:hypothetical protein